MNKIFLYALALIVLIVLSFNVLSLVNLMNSSQKLEFSKPSQENFSKAVALENSLDKCKTPEGYTDEQWKEHMGHHPDRYAECLK